MKETVGQAIRDLGPHDTCISIEALCKPVVSEDRNRVQLSFALGKGAGGASASYIDGTCPEAVLLFVVIGGGQIEIGPDRVFHTGPKYLEYPELVKLVLLTVPSV